MFNIDKDINHPSSNAVIHTALCLQESFQQNTASFSDWSELVEDYSRQHGISEAREMMAVLAETIETAFTHLSGMLGNSHFLEEFGAYDIDVIPTIAEQLAGSINGGSITSTTPEQVAELFYKLASDEVKAQIDVAVVNPVEPKADLHRQTIRRLQSITRASYRNLYFALSHLHESGYERSDIAGMMKAVKGDLL